MTLESLHTRITLLTKEISALQLELVSKQKEKKELLTQSRDLQIKEFIEAGKVKVIHRNKIVQPKPIEVGTFTHEQLATYISDLSKVDRKDWLNSIKQL